MSLLYQFLPVSLNLSRLIRLLIAVVFVVPVGRAQDVSQGGNRAHDATIGGYLSDTGEECTQDHVGRAGGHLVIAFIVSWSTMGGIVMIDGYLHHATR